MARPRPLSHFAARILAVVLGVAMSTAASSGLVMAQMPVTELHWLSPPGGKAGTSLDVNVAGGNQEDVTQLLFSHPGIKAEVKQAAVNEFLTAPQPVSGQFTVTIAADVPPGPYDAWVVGRFGVSNVKTFVVGTNDEWKDDGSNRALASAKELALGTVVNGIADANSMDYYRVALKQGQRVLAACTAQRIDSRLNGQIVVMDETGRELGRDLGTVSYDPILDFTAPADGNYIFAVSDFYFDGGNDYFYRLRIHSEPRVDFVFPPSGVPGSTADYQIYGRNLPGGKPSVYTLDGATLDVVTQSITLPAAAEGAEMATHLDPNAISLDLIPYSFAGAPATILGLASGPVVVEQEPNSDPLQPQAITVPCEVAGQFYPERDDDWFVFEAKKGDVYAVDIVSQRLGLDVDPFLMIERLVTDDQGNTTAANVAQVDDPGNRNNLIGLSFDYSTDDPSYRFVAPEDGKYRVLARDQFGDSRRDPRRVYRLRIRQESPDFRLYAVAEEIKVANNNQVPFFALGLRRGSSTLLKVIVDRVDGFDGEISLSVEGLPAGVTCPQLILSTKQDIGWLCLETAKEAAPWVGPIEVVGRSKLGEADVVRKARPGSITWGSGNNQQARPEFRLTRGLMASVVTETAPAHVAVGEDKIYETSLGGSLDLPIQLARGEGFGEAVKLVANNIPSELKPADVDIAGDKSEGTLKLVATNGNAKPGTYSFFVRGDTKFKYTRNPEAVARVEEQQKQITEIVNQLTEQVKQLTTARDGAVQKAQEAANAAKAAQEAQAAAAKAAEAATATAQQATQKAAAAKEAADKDTANAALAEAATAAQAEAAKAEEQRATAAAAAEKAQAALNEAQAAQKQAEEAKTAAEQELKQTQDKAKRATDTKTALDKQVADVKKANQPADLNIALVSAPIKVRIVPTPIQLTAAENAKQVKRTEKLELPIQVVRNYGFAEPVELTVEFPKEATGITVEKVSVPGDQGEGKLIIAPSDKAATGAHTVVVRAKGQFQRRADSESGA